MATREENLKKINEELEKLDDEQLEKVAGGNILDDLIEKLKHMNINPPKFYFPFKQNDLILLTQIL